MNEQIPQKIISKASLFLLLIGIVAVCLGYACYGYSKAALVMEAKPSISKEIYFSSTYEKYSDNILSYQDENMDSVLFSPYQDYSTIIKEVENCASVLKIKPKHIHKLPPTNSFPEFAKPYTLKKDAKVDTKPFLDCVDEYLAVAELSPENVMLLSNSPQYKKEKDEKNPELLKKISEVKAKGKMTSLDGLQFISILNENSKKLQENEQNEKKVNLKTAIELM